MKKIAVLLLSLLFAFLGFSVALAATVDLYDWAFNVNGSLYEHFEYVGDDSAGDPIYKENDFSILPGSFDYSSFDQTDGLGTLTWYTSAAGNHNFIAFFDHEIDEEENTYYNEYGVALNTPAIQSWEIDEPGYISGNIYDNVLAGTLDNTNSVPKYSVDDVSWAMGWKFTLAADESALIKLVLSDTAAPSEGFYMEQVDPDSDKTIYFLSTLDINPVPEPATLLLIGTGLAGLLGIRRKKYRK